MGGGELIRRRERVSNRRREHRWSFSNILWEEDVLNLPQLGVNKDSCPIECFCPCLSAVVPAYSCHLFCQPGLRLLPPTFVGCHLHGLKSFPGHPSCIFSFLQLNLKIQDQLSLGGQLYLGYVKLLVLVLSLGLRTLQIGFSIQMCPLQGGQLVG